MNKRGSNVTQPCKVQPELYDYVPVAKTQDNTPSSTPKLQLPSRGINYVLAATLYAKNEALRLHSADKKSIHAGSPLGRPPLPAACPTYLLLVAYS